MHFELKNINKSVSDITRTIGYKPTHLQKEGEISIVRQLGRNPYPRFHVHIRQSGQDFHVKQSFDSTQDKLNSYEFNLHLDQKKPSYRGAVAHSGEYEGEIVQEEANRIMEALT